MTEKELETFRESYESLQQFSARYRGDEALRTRIENGDYGDLQGAGAVPAGAEVRVVCQTPEVFYMLMPEDPGAAISDQAMGAVVGGYNAFASFLTTNCIGGTVSTQASIGTAASEY